MNNINTINMNATYVVLLKKTEVISNLFNRFYYAMSDVQKENLRTRLEAVQMSILEELEYADKDEEKDLNSIYTILDKYDSLMKNSKSSSKSSSKS